MAVCEQTQINVRPDRHRVSQECFQEPVIYLRHIAVITYINGFFFFWKSSVLVAHRRKTEKTRGDVYESRF